MKHSHNLTSCGSAGLSHNRRPFGRTLTQPTNPALHIGFTGHDRTTADTSLNLVYMNARYYMPGSGRFLNPDTLIPDPSIPQSFNRYSYVLNQPTIGTDPDGHCYPACTAAAGAFIGGAIAGATYYLTTPASERNWTDGLLATGAGAVGGALIGAGIGIAAQGAVAVAAGAGASITASSSALVSAGTGALVAAESQMIGNAITGSSFNRAEFAVNTAAATVEGALAPGLGSAMSVVSSGLFGAAASVVSDVVQGNPVNIRNAASNGTAGIIGGAVGSAVDQVVAPVIKPIRRGPQTLDLTLLMGVRDPVIRRMWAVDSMKKSVPDAARTFARGVAFDVASDRLQDQLR